MGLQQGDKTNRDNGVFGLIALNVVLFFLDHVLGLEFMRGLYLDHQAPRWYQFLTSLFCHANWSHLSGNLFFLYVFGKLVEQEEGAFGVVASYLICGLGANLIVLLFQSGAGYSLGASGAVFGLFAVSVLIRLKMDWRNVVEVVILGQFVIVQVLNEARLVGASDGVGHLAHVGGAVTGSATIYLLARLLRKVPAPG